MPPRGYRTEDVKLELVSRALKETVSVRVRQGARRGPQPLLFVHDGPEYVRRAGLLRLLERLPALRTALVQSSDREEQYAASPAYGRALATELLPTLDSGGPRIGLGSSLGALALLHAHRTHPESFDGLVLQSGQLLPPPHRLAGGRLSPLRPDRPVRGWAPPRRGRVARSP